MRRVFVDLPQRGYEILIEKGLLKNVGKFLSAYKGKKCAIITDSNVGPIYGSMVQSSLEGINAKIIEVKSGEGSKSMKTLEEVYDKIFDMGFTRSDFIIALGGGVIGDLAGFAASTILRGVDFIQIPTTLLAQVDSSVGGKTAVNVLSGKNLVGAFYQPKMVLIDPDCLSTLPDREISCGMGEVIKYGCIRDKNLFEDLENKALDYDEIIEICCKIKAQVVAGDEHDHGERMILNFGHTIGHAIEKGRGYENGTHGEAVAAGMCIIAKYGEATGETEAGTYDRICSICEKYNLPTNADDIDIKAAMLDKKSSGDNINIIMLREIGNCFIKNVPKSTLYDIVKGA